MQQIPRVDYRDHRMRLEQFSPPMQMRGWIYVVTVLEVGLETIVNLRPEIRRNVCQVGLYRDVRTIWMNVLIQSLRQTLEDTT
ncbi:hypothetical protein DPMN_098511 [Dreissena polymorpha]|uniref:Uncharacterized protein n=1 Tax=Dreissena polymorpha TaxID=45954 RepID=A0A9D4LD58_DREPO|nr:hypothetical protein DPMN_098511 [Dreissena polymorpha]